jgi:hypothetical protein
MRKFKPEGEVLRREWEKVRSSTDVDLSHRGVGGWFACPRPRKKICHREGG